VPLAPPSRAGFAPPATTGAAPPKSKAGAELPHCNDKAPEEQSGSRASALQGRLLNPSQPDDMLECLRVGWAAHPSMTGVFWSQ